MGTVCLGLVFRDNDSNFIGSREVASLPVLVLVDHEP